MPGMTICTNAINPSDDDLNAASSSVESNDCKSIKLIPGSKVIKSETTTNPTTSTTTATNDTSASVTALKATTNSVCKSLTKKPTSSGSSLVTIGKSTPEQQTKPSIVGTKSQNHPNNSTLVISSSSNPKPLKNQQQKQSTDQQKKSRNILCPSCSSPDVIEVNLKLKSCKRCHDVVVDELNCKSQLNDSKKSLESTSNNSNMSQYNQQMAIITKKLKNIYKNRIHSTTIDNGHSSSNQQQKFNGIVQSSSQSEISVIAKTSMTSSSASTEIINSVTKTTTTTTTINTENQIEQQQQNHNHNHQNSCNCSSVSNKLPLKHNSNKDLMNKDVLILRICDLDLKLKSKQEDKLSSANMTDNRNSNFNNKNLVSKSSNSLQQQSQSQICSAKSDLIPLKLSPKIKEYKSIGTQDNINDIINKSRIKSDNINLKSSRKIVVISDEFKKKSEKMTDIRIENRKEMIKRFRQNNAISKSLDVIGTDDIDLVDNIRKHKIASNTINEPAYIFTSKSVTNLNKTEEQLFYDDDDDDGPFESINSVELIFISDEFLNKAVKHDLKIIKNKNLQSFDSDYQQQQQQQQQLKSSGKKKLKKSQTIQSNTSPGAAPLKVKNIEKQQSLSVSPKNVTNKTTNTVPSSSSSGNIKSSSASCSGNKKLIIISEDFKRKSLENNIVILDDNNINNVTNSDAIAIKRRNLKQLKLTRQQSSIDDVGNQMTTHAFRSFEEPEEQCLESKEIKSPD